MERHEFERAVKGVAEEMLSRDGELMPAIYAVPHGAPPGEVAVIQVPTADEAQKEMLAEAICELRAAMVLFAFVSEAWASEQDEMAPEDDPEREEVVLANFYHGLEASSEMASILRHGSGATLGPWTEIEGLAGRFHRGVPSFN